MSKKKKSVYSSIMDESIGYGTAGIIAGNLSNLSGDSAPMNAFKIGSSLAGVPSLMKVSKNLLKGFDEL